MLQNCTNHEAKEGDRKHNKETMKKEQLLYSAQSDKTLTSTHIKNWDGGESLRAPTSPKIISD